MKPIPSSAAHTRCSASALDIKAKKDLRHSLRLRISRIRSMLPRSSRWATPKSRGPDHLIRATVDRCTAASHGRGSLPWLIGATCPSLRSKALTPYHGRNQKDDFLSALARQREKSWRACRCRLHFYPRRNGTGCELKNWTVAGRNGADGGENEVPL